jgi:hypothetical protein
VGSFLLPWSVSTLPAFVNQRDVVPETVRLLAWPSDYPLHMPR